MKLYAFLARILLPATLLPASVLANTNVRVATWNIEQVGTPGSPEYNAALSILGRIDADIVFIQGVPDPPDSVNGEALAADAGYLVVDVPEEVAIYGGLILAKNAAGNAQLWDATTLSGDPSANDISSPILEVHFDLPDNDRDLIGLTTVWKDGPGDEDEFRRAVESARIAQVLEKIGNGTCASCPGLSAPPGILVIGDINEEITAVPQSPNPFTSLPAGLPMSYVLGSDLATELAGPGIQNDPFHYIELYDFPTVLDALQLDGSDVTRPASGRRLDYIYVSPVILNPQGETYDSADEGLPGGLPKAGGPLPPNTSSDASPNLPVFGDLVLPNSWQVLPISPPNSVIFEGDLTIKVRVLDPGCDDKCMDVELEWDDDFTFSSPSSQNSLTNPEKFRGASSGDHAPLLPPEPVITELAPPPPGTYWWRLRVKDTTQPTFEYNPWSEPRSFTVDPTGPPPPLVDWFQTTAEQFQDDQLFNAMTDGDGVIIMNEAEPATLTTPTITLTDLTRFDSSVYSMWDQVIVNVTHPDPVTSIQVDVLDPFDVPIVPSVFDSGPGTRDVHVTVAAPALKIKVRTIMTPGSTPRINSIRATGDPATALAVPEPPSRARFRLLPATPNPFRASTRIGLEVPEGVDPVSLRVYDLQGRRVRTLLHNESISGEQSVVWDGRDDRGIRLPTGIYLYQLVGESSPATGQATGNGAGQATGNGAGQATGKVLLIR